MFADLAWREGLSCGLRFGESLGQECLLETRRQAGMRDLQKDLREIAKARLERNPN